MSYNDKQKESTSSKTVIIVALIGAFSTILAALITIFKEPLTTLIFPTPIPTTTEIANDSDADITLLTGVWNGEFKTDNAGPWDILLTLSGNCRLNEICGTIQFDRASCTASVTIISVKNNRYEFIAKKVEASPECLPVDYQYLEYTGTNTLNYLVGWTDADGHHVEGRGVLNKAHD